MYNPSELVYHIDPRVHVVSGSFPPSTVAVDDSYTLSIASGKDVKLSVANGGSYTFSATADGSVKAYIDCSVYCGASCNVIIQRKVGGTAGNSYKLSILPHGGTGGVVIREDTVNMIVTILYRAGVSTIANVHTALGSTTLVEIKTAGTSATVITSAEIYNKSFSGGTAVTWGAYSSGLLTLHYTGSVSTNTSAVSVLNAVTGNPLTAALTTTGSSGTVITTAEAVVTSALVGGVTAVALNNTYKWGSGYTVARTGATGTGSYTITFEDSYATQGELLNIETGYMDTAARGYIVVPGAYSSANKTLLLTVFETDASPIVADPAPSTDAVMISFRAYFRLSK